MKNKLSLVLSFGLLLPLLSGCNNSKENVNNFSKNYANVYNGDLESEVGMNIYYFNNSEIPYLNIKELYEGKFLSLLLDKENAYSYSNNVVTNNLTGSTMSLDSINSTLTFDDFNMFNNIDGLDYLPNDVYSSFEHNKTLQMNKDKSSYNKGKSIVIDLKNYDTTIINLDNNLYLPFGILESLTISQRGFRYAFNGNDIYLIENDVIAQNGNLTNYGQSLYNGKFGVNYKRTEEYSNYYFNQIKFELDYFNGKIFDYNLSPIGNNIPSEGLTTLTSNDALTSNSALAGLINYYFHDGGHTSFNGLGFGTPYNEESDSKLQGSLIAYDKKLYNATLREMELTKLREESNSNKNLDIYDETAVIRFDHFTSNDSDEKMISNLDNDTSTFALFYNSFKEIEKNNNIKNVVIDLSLNGGGESSALAHAYSFISNDSLVMNLIDPLTGATYKEAIDVDNDLDGDFKDNDSYEGKYNFYILTSNVSFSCGNIFPTYAKDNKKATIIGEASSGGDCTVRTSVAIDGSKYQMSSNIRYLHNDGTSADNGIEVDIPLDSSYYYNIQKLNDYLKTK